MLRAEDRAMRIAEWREHLEGWKASGEALRAYARGHGIDPGSMYYWRNVLRREGHWLEPQGDRKVPVAADSPRVPLRFARVKIEPSKSDSVIMIRLRLTNGRRARIELRDTQCLSEVLNALERSP
jgi:transposase-like protein